MGEKAKSKCDETPALFHCPPAQLAVPADPRPLLAVFGPSSVAGADGWTGR